VDGRQEELDPGDRVAGLVDRLQRLVVAAAVALQVGGEIEQRRGEAASGDEEEDE
jgi:hypothetical protein